MNDDGRLKFVWKIGFSSAKSKSNKIFHRTFFKQKINFQRCCAFRLAFAGMVGKSLQPCLLMKYTVVLVGNEVEQSFPLEDFQILWHAKYSSHLIENNVLFPLRKNFRRKETCRILIGTNFENERINSKRNKPTFSCATFFLCSSSSSWCLLASFSIWAITFGLDFHTSRLISIIWLQ